MKNIRAFLLLISVLVAATPTFGASVRTSDIARRDAENQIRSLLEPILEKYCQMDPAGLSSCKLMSVQASVDLATPERLAPGFDDIDPEAMTKVEPTSAAIKLLIDEKIGPVSRGKLIDLLQQHLDTLDYPVKIETKIASFPQPFAAAGKVAAIREKITREFSAKLEDLIQRFCPGRCMVADFNLQTELVNPEETQYGPSGEFVEEQGTAVRIRNIAATLLTDLSMAAEEQANLLEMARLKTNHLKNVTISARMMRFPKKLVESEAGNYGQGTDGDLAADGRPGSGRGMGRWLSQETKNQTDSTQRSNTEANNQTTSTNNSQNNNERHENYQRIERIERVENGDAVQAELQKFKVYGLGIAGTIIAFLVLISALSFRKSGSNSVHTLLSGAAPAASGHSTARAAEGAESSAHENTSAQLVAKRYEVERLLEELTAIFAQQPRVAKTVFTRLLTEEGIEVTAHYLHLFGEMVLLDLLRDPSLQTDMNGLMEFYAKNPIQMTDDDKLELLQRLHHRTVAAKLVVMGNRSSNLFDFLADMDGTQVFELIRNESLTVQAITCTQCDPQKRAKVYQLFDETHRMKLLGELSRIDYLPKDYIFNVAGTLKRKRRDNPRLNTEALPGSEVLVSLLERTGETMQREVLRNLELSQPDGARVVKAKLVSVDTLRYLRDGQLLEVVLSLKHDELLQFLKGAPGEIRGAIYAKSPKDLVAELEEELEQIPSTNRESYHAVERKILNRIKVMANDGVINLFETNDRMFNDPVPAAQGAQTSATSDTADSTKVTPIRRAAGW